MAGHHQQLVPSSLIVGPWPTEQSSALEPSASTLREGKPAHPWPHDFTTAEEEQEVWVK
jgi:hypothetical protein